MESSYNFTARAWRSISYNTYISYNKPSYIQQGDTTLGFRYGANRELFQQQVYTPYKATTRTLVNAYYEKEVSGGIGGLTTHIHNIRVGGETVAVYKSRSDDTEETRYLHKDHLKTTAISHHSVDKQVIKSMGCYFDVRLGVLIPESGLG